MTDFSTKVDGKLDGSAAINNYDPDKSQGLRDIPDSEVHGANMGPIWGRQDPGGPHVGPMNFAICDIN